MSRIAVVLVSLVAIAGCDAAPAAPTQPPRPARPAPARPAPSKPAPKPIMHPITVTWKLARTAGALELAYTVENTSDKPVVLLDRLYQATAKGNLPLFDRAIVRGESATSVAFVRAYVPPPPSVGVGNPTPPIGRTLAPKEKITDHATIALPLAAWHNFVRAWPALAGTPTEAVFELGYLVGHDKWATIELTDGSKLQTPSPPFVNAQVVWRSEMQPIP